MPDELIPALAIVVISALLALSGWRGVPGLGIIGSVAVITWVAWYGGSSLAGLGFVAPSNLALTVTLGVVIGTAIQVLSVMVIEPLSDRITRSSHDHRIVEAVRDSWLSLVQWLLVVWLFVAPVEEVIFRGFLLKQIAALASGAVGPVIAVASSSAIFGLSHLYQGKSGALSAALIGSMLGVLFVWAGYNLWLPIIAHGVIDTVGLLLIATGRLEHLQRIGLGRLRTT
ncbi:CAAX amino terminal protease self- immunity [bacterium BMS3Bbin02]|nr:CAAX amino terminal protease self- immunity [bacterium BMS3Bbin02]